ncbi:3-deoxy-7-phosphoheptulonate synthase class II [Candidatus Riflebacteria bacterium]
MGIKSLKQKRTWQPDSWRHHEILQQPSWQDRKALQRNLNYIANQQPLVVCCDVDNLKKRLAQVQAGKAFILQAGDCAESFSYATPEHIQGRLRIILQMAAVLCFGAGKPIVRIGRIAGQYGKPRSKPTEKVNGIEFPSYRGDLVNEPEADECSRTPNPQRLIRAFQHASTTLNLLRAYCSSDFASLSNVHAWNMEFIKETRIGQAYEKMANDIDNALNFFEACGLDVSNQPEFQAVEMFSSHEALVLEYEQMFIKRTCMNGWYDSSGHFLWIGDRTRQTDGAHIEFFRGLSNPIGIKIGPSCTEEDLETYLHILNPENEPGRLTLITRLGRKVMEEKLPKLIKVVQNSGIDVSWLCDPMHENTFSCNGYKTRKFEDIFGEIEMFFQIHHEHGTYPGGIHLESTFENVTECLGGQAGITSDDLGKNYKSSCDPRLNGVQALELAFLVADILKKTSRK